MIKVTEEMVASFFHGFCINAFLAELCEVGGRNHSPTYSNIKMVDNADNFMKRLVEQRFRQMKLEDALEIAFEFTSYRKIVDLVGMLWSMTGIIKSGNMVYHEMVRDFMARQVSDEAILSYFVGMSWIFGKDEPNRNERLEKFFKLVIQQLELKISREQMMEIWFYFMDDLVMEEWRSIAHEMMNTRYMITGKVK